MTTFVVGEGRMGHNMGEGGIFRQQRRKWKVTVNVLWMQGTVNPRVIPLPLTSSPFVAQAPSHRLAGEENLGRKKSSEWALSYGVQSAG